MSRVLEEEITRLIKETEEKDIDCCIHTRKKRPDRWMQQLSWSLSRWETQDIKTQPKFNQYVDSLPKTQSFGCPIG